MNATDSADHIAVTDMADGAGVIVRFRDAFLNYATSENLAADLKTLCRERSAGGVRWFVADLSAVVVMDSCGLSMLVAMKRTAEAGGARLRLFGLSPVILRLFAVTKLERVFDICDDESAALAPLVAASQAR
jgi:anti-sigma B factor antagonist